VDSTHNKVDITSKDAFSSSSTKRMVCGIPCFDGIASKNLLYSLNLKLQDWVELLPSIFLIIIL
jgi:hypothetical protein